MAFAMDTLGYSKHLREAGISIEQAEAHAEAAREFIMTEVVTKADLTLALDHLSLQLTVRLASVMGGMLALAIAILATIIKL